MAASTVSAVLITLTCILVPLSLLTVWVHDIVLDTDRYVATVSPLASDPAIEAAAVHRVTEAAGVRVDGARVASDLAGWLQAQGLPPRVGTAVKSLGPQLDAAVEAAVSKVATRFVESDRFETVWTTANRAAHSAVVHALTGHGRGAVEVEGGTVTLDVGAAVDKVKQELVAAGLSPAQKIPEVDKQMVLFQSAELGKIRGAVHLLDVVGNWLPVLTVVLGTIGVLLARRRRRALVTTSLCAAAACLLLALGLVLARRYYLGHLPAQVQSPAAAAAVFDTLVRFLRVAVRTAAVLGVLVALGAYLSGAGRLPRGVRGTAERAADSAAGWGAAHGVRTGRAGTWVSAHRRPLTTGVLLVLALVFALWNHPTVLTVLLLVLILLVVLAVLALLAAGGRAGSRPREPGA
ncbi:aromatic ring-opening dioxygenase LigA [Streptomyces sp. CB00455]|nr:aromatic ring-opening dioxygenase LigA [Streptomyces sp. CB00455]